MLTKFNLILFLFISQYNFSQELTVEKIWKNYEFYGSSVDGFRSMQDGNYFSKITSTEKGDAITKHKFTDYQGEGEVIISAEILNQVKMDDYSFNQDETKALITTESKSIYRRSYKAVYYVLDIKTGTLNPLDNERQPQTLAEYSPDGKSVSYIYNNNIFVKNLETNAVTQLTIDGKTNEIINGTTDWVYEEEFAITKGYSWSPDSKYIAFLKFDESNVKEFTMTYYNELYPDLYTFKYPKAGENNSIVTANICDVKKNTVNKIELSDYEYIPRFKWSNTTNKLVIQTLNRHQNILTYHLLDADKNTKKANEFFTEKSSTYIDIDDNLLILKDGNTILRTSESNGYNHIYKLCFDGVSSEVTKGNWDVIQFLGINETDGTIYYTSAEDGAINKTIYKINITGKNKNELVMLLEQVKPNFQME